MKNLSCFKFCFPYSSSINCQVTHLYIHQIFTEDIVIYTMGPGLANMENKHLLRTSYVLCAGYTNTSKTWFLFSKWFYRWRQTWRHLLFFGVGGQAVRHTQLSQSEIKPMPPALEVWSLNYWTDREMQNRSFLIWYDMIHTMIQEYAWCMLLLLLSRPVAWPHVTPWTAACYASLSLTISHSVPKFMFTIPVMSSSHLILWCPLLLPSVIPIIREFSNESYASDDQNTGASALPSVLPVNIQGWSHWRLTGLISLLSKRLLGVFSSTIVWRHQFFDVLTLWSSFHSCMWPLGRP